MRVIVVGGGAVGLCVAEALSARDAEVVVLERGRCGSGASAGNAGWITPSLALPLADPSVVARAAPWLLRPCSPLSIRPTPTPALLGWVGRFLTRCRRPAYRRALASLQALAAEAAPAFDRLAQRGARFEHHDEALLYPALDADELADLRRVARDLRIAGGFAELHELGAADARTLEPALHPAVVGAMLAPAERQVRPESLCAGLGELLHARDVPVREHVIVTAVTREGARWRVHTSAGEHSADAVVLAAGAGTRRLVQRLGVALPMVAAKGYSRTFTHAGQEPGSPRRAVYLESARVAVSVFDGAARVSGHLELGAVDLTVSPRRLEAITQAVRQAFPDWPMTGPALDWAGWRTLSPDGLPYIGPVLGGDGLHVATGHGTLGITLAPLTGELVAARLLEGRLTATAAVADPRRMAQALPASFTPPRRPGPRAGVPASVRAR